MKSPAKIRASQYGTQEVAENLYIYGYPLVLSELVRRKTTAVLHPSFRRAPVNQFAHRRFPAAPYEKDDIHPHADCLRSCAWLDLRKEPIVLSVPRIDRYYLFTLWSAWYEIFDTLGTGQTDSSGGDFVLCGPRFSQTLPDVFRQITAPTDTVWLDGYFEIGAVDDIGPVHSIQDQLRLTPLTEYPSRQSPRSIPVLAETATAVTPQKQVELMQAHVFYTLLSRLLDRNPPPANEADLVKDFANVGFTSSRTFAFDSLPTPTSQAMSNAIFGAHARIVEAADTCPRPGINNWWRHVHPGRFHTNYLARAAAAYSSAGGSLASDILCFHVELDREGQPLRGTNRYTVTFPKDEMPPVNGFWSLTLYNCRNVLVQNFIHRYTLHDRDRLRLEADGSLSLHIQSDWPGESRDSNWLPAPKETFSLVFRMYWPKPEALDANWQPPAVTRTNS